MELLSCLENLKKKVITDVLKHDRCSGFLLP